MDAHFFNWNWNNWNNGINWNTQVMCYFSLLYKATKCYANLVVHAEGIPLYREILSDFQLFEFQSQAAIIIFGHRNEPPIVNVRIALLRCRMALQERVVVLPVAHQHDDIERQTSSRATGAVLSF